MNTVLPAPSYCHDPPIENKECHPSFFIVEWDANGHQDPNKQKNSGVGHVSHHFPKMM
ncbi:hypothetical protein K6U45_06760 [Vibrio vulnificus]|uniref:hypothetical protein n=1 Tax=Vibrio vulnificus TaxID=672 RepID=UPI001EEC1D77|nr:hypothetical protein [Vibrio vulnificus]MCG6299554.1 hypothetical protein [Vibrio vulnificus]